MLCSRVLICVQCRQEVLLGRGEIGISLLGRRLRVLLGFEILFALVFEQTEVLISLLQRIMVAIERVNHIILVHIDLIFNIDVLLDEINKLLHLFAEQDVNVVGKLVT